jgi:HlyD family secretion protein
VLYDEATDGDEGGEETAYVFVMQDGKAVRKDVEAGLSSDSDQEIISGLDEGEVVISGPFRVLRHLVDGEAVEAREESSEDETNSVTVEIGN